MNSNYAGFLVEGGPQKVSGKNKIIQLGEVLSFGAIFKKFA